VAPEFLFKRSEGVSLHLRGRNRKDAVTEWQQISQDISIARIKGLLLTLGINRLKNVLGSCARMLLSDVDATSSSRPSSLFISSSRPSLFASSSPPPYFFLLQSRPSRESKKRCRAMRTRSSVNIAMEFISKRSEGIHLERCFPPVRKGDAKGDAWVENH